MMSTDGVRAELASLPLPDRAVARAELAGALRFSGVVRRRGGAHETWSWVSTLSSTAARRVDRLVTLVTDERPELRAQRIASPRPRLLVELEIPERMLGDVGLDAVTDGGAGGVPGWLDTEGLRWAYARGVSLAGLRLSNPRRAHCEIEAPTEQAAVALVELLAGLGVRASAAPLVRERWRVVCKSRTAIGTLLAGTGATSAYLAWEEERARHAVRAAATRGANADTANARRSVRAATAQVATALAVLGRVDVDDVAEDLRTTALARLANPTLSLAELAGLLDVSRATISRRFARLAQLAPPAGDAAD